MHTLNGLTVREEGVSWVIGSGDANSGYKSMRMASTACAGRQISAKSRAIRRTTWQAGHYT